jgi:hypothetical protein
VHALDLLLLVAQARDHRHEMVAEVADLVARAARGQLRVAALAHRLRDRHQAAQGCAEVAQQHEPHEQDAEAAGDRQAEDEIALRAQARDQRGMRLREIQRRARGRGVDGDAPQQIAVARECEALHRRRELASGDLLSQGAQHDAAVLDEQQLATGHLAHRGHPRRSQDLGQRHRPEVLAAVVHRRGRDHLQAARPVEVEQAGIRGACQPARRNRVAQVAARSPDQRAAAARHDQRAVHLQPAELPPVLLAQGGRVGAQRDGDEQVLLEGGVVAHHARALGQVGALDLDLPDELLGDARQVVLGLAQHQIAARAIGEQQHAGQERQQHADVKRQPEAVSARGGHLSGTRRRRGERQQLVLAHLGA